MKIVGAFLAILGMGALGFAGWELWAVSALLTRGVSVAGEVVDIESSGTTKEGEPFYYPVYEYTDVHGGEHRRRAKIGSTRPEVEVGDGVDVLYVESAPADSVIQEFDQLWLRPAVAGLFGGVFLIFGVVMYLEIGTDTGEA